jgi:hypothetical protein
MERSCQKCGASLDSNSPRRLYCEACARSGHASRTLSRAAARTERSCPTCSALFVPRTARQRLCSECSPKVKAHFARSQRTKARREGPTEFIGVDGEGVSGPCEQCACKGFSGQKRCSCGHDKDHHRHIYVLLTVGERHLENPEGLGHQEIFSFLYQQYLARPHAAFVGYFLSYDFNMWLRDLDEDKAWLLFTAPGQRRRRYGKDYQHIAPVRLNEGRPGSPDAWEIDLLADKRFGLRPLICACHTLPKAKRPHVEKECPQRRVHYMSVCDSGPFFQTSFLKAIDPKEWGEHPVCSEEEFEALDKGKKRRAVAVLDEEMRAYNRLENLVLARLLGRLEEGLRSLDIGLKRFQWYGPGAAVAEWFQMVRLPKREAVEKFVPYFVRQAATASYTGGWFELAVHGFISGSVWEYDIASAYAYIMSGLPCLVHGKWRQYKEHIPQLREGQLRLVHCPPGGVRGSDPYFGAMLHRRRDGYILRPQVTGGWFWQHELEAAKRAGVVDEFLVDEAWTFTPGCSCEPPLAGMGRLYEHRLTVGKKTPAGKAAKLIMNAGYGKLAQSVGQRPYGNMVYASLITSGIRSMLLDAIATHPMGTKSVVMVATDSLFFLSPHPALREEKVLVAGKEAPKVLVAGKEAPKLGSWEGERHEDLCLLKPGVYWHNRSRQDIQEGTSPLFKCRGIKIEAFAKHLPELDEQAKALAAELEYRARQEYVGVSEEATAPDEALYLDELERLGLGPGTVAAPPPRRQVRTPWGREWRSPSAAYDWFYSLAAAEQKRLRERWFSDSPYALAPDEVVERIPIERWLGLTRRADLARMLASGRKPRNLARYGHISPRSVGSGKRDIPWPEVVYELDFALVSCKQALQRRRWDLAGKVSSAKVTQSANPRAKRAEAYFDEEFGVVRTAPYDKADELESTPYTPGYVKESMASLLDMPFEEAPEDYITPDGPAAAIFFGQLGTGQWA